MSSKSKFTIKPGQLAQMVTTGEPVLVKSIINGPSLGESTATVIRPVVTREGIDHREEVYSLDMLETIFTKLKHDLDVDVFKVGLVEKFEGKRYALNGPQEKLLRDAAIETGLKQYKSTTQA